MARVRSTAWHVRACGSRSRSAPAARATARPRRWRRPSGQLGASAISAIERGVLHHPLHELVKCYARKRLRVLAHVTSRSCRAGCGPQAEEATCSLDAVVEAEIRNSSRPGSQAPHAPPALTFGLPGKQRVKSVRAGRVLIRLLSSLPQIRKDFSDGPTRAIRRSGLPRPRPNLFRRASFRQRDLVAQEIGELDSLGVKRLRIERGLGQARQGVGLEIDRPLVRDDEIGAGIAAA